MNMKGKTAIVTGGGRDIGRACVMRLAEAGANVVINYHSSSEGADSAVSEIEAAGGKAIAMQGDMTNQADVDALVAKTVETFGSIDSLIHVTGGLVARKTTEESTLEHWNTVMSLNLTSLFMTVKACTPHMGEGSSIVTFASQAGRDGGGPGATAYAASKGAVMTYTRGLAKELGPKIRVNSLCPGMIDTDFHNIFTKDEVRQHVANITPLKREGTSEEVANLTVFLASDEASFMTGNNVDINGGISFS
ncbi:SDR family NAD(P)-dependent oxidoreductase [Cocleimonas flava]|jgi:3-oxoacyl-[acyl-carrier protein] reductase|uniref:3-oxoacyl-[acyl-carrier protein] reductase n=1 Tax=Cocleimonas flava TaxID=634765 RepID=A0A4R1EQ29_9GAMM|nr:MULTISPECIES: glucose 1-dehydrogenase [Cocleimonas]MEB8432725.1 glucose 1-dehydrogenase [Cocleimonas sp. KMM 6892]MEC4715584.1 glucose 1-dehydrogenase [Cocleimonas sp. KMM 6895]MEC4744798.1 glucose 1-dehydrogenase [Cocleimonas sp. KMM 6896]TCJ83153.1 3-oxoacyl-[acyl-carrier protein] reductase [Cocleimonas flava]